MDTFLYSTDLERWCRLRGNLFFIFRTKDPWSEPAYVVVLENYQVQIDPPTQCCVFKDNDLFAFYLGKKFILYS